MFEVTAEVVRDLLDYDPETGVFRWKFRDRKYCESDKSWKICNTRREGKTAGTLDKSDGYRRIKIFTKFYKAHRLAWLHYYGEWPSDQIDHVNCIRDDNRIENLREATNQQNGMNSSSQFGTSQYKGVCWDKHRNKWQAQIGINGKLKKLGRFEIEIEAARAYDRAAIEHFGIYAKLNFPIEDYLDYIEELEAA